MSHELSVALPLRAHTILGVCEAIGQDFGFNPTLLRVPLAALVIYNMWLAIGVYIALGAAVLLSRLIFPRREAIAAAAPELPRAANSEVEERAAA